MKTNGKNIKYFKTCANMLYVNFWSTCIPEFEELNASRIGINAKSKKPIIDELNKKLFNCSF